MSEWNEATSRRQRCYERKSQGWRAQSGLRAPEWQCAACQTRSFLSKGTCRGCSKQRDEKRDECINEWAQTAAWPQQGGASSGDDSHPVNKPKGAAQALAQARQQLAQAKATGMPERCIRILEEEVQKEEAAMKLAQPMGQRLDQARARFRRIVEAGGREGDAKGVEGRPCTSYHEQMATANYVQLATTLRTPSRITTSCLSTLR